MFWKKKENTEKRLMQINQTLSKSFDNVKRDTSSIFQWLNYFYRRSMEQESTIKQLRMELSYMPKTREEIRKIIDDYYSFESMMAKVRDLNQKVDWLAGNFESHKQEISGKIENRQHQIMTESHSVSEPVGELHAHIESIRERLQKLEQKKDFMKEKIIKKITRNSKDYVKSVILSYIRKYERISALQLKDIIVDEQHFCSKSSFYRLLEEVEQIEDIGVIKDGKEKHYLSKERKEHV